MGWSGTFADESLVVAADTKSDGSRESAQKAVQYLLADIDANETDNRERAWEQHIARALQQLLVCATAVTLGAVALATRPQLLSSELATCMAANPSSCAWVAWPIGFWLLAVGLLIGGVALLYYYHWRQREYWELATSEASRREPEKCARGYLSIFLIYTRTKHTAFFTRLFGVVTLVSSAMVLLALWQGQTGVVAGTSIPIWLALSALPLLAVLLSLLVLYKGFELGRDFVPGRALVKNTIIMSFLATTSATDYTAASNSAQIVLEKIRNERPWSFYSFRTPRGSGER